MDELDGALFVASVIVSAALTALVRWAAGRSGFVAQPRTGRWSQRVVPLGGGVAIVLTLAIALPVADPRLALTLLPGLVMIALLGLADDRKGVPPVGKLMVQALAALYVVSWGLRLELSSELIAVPVTVLFIVGLCNSVNLLDNMDGVASSVVGVAALGVWAACGVDAEGLATGRWALVLAAVSFGFLAHNRPPAAIFMGDTGSLSLGFCLAALVTRVEPPSGAAPWGAVALAALFSFVPCLDTLLVLWTRRLAGRRFLVGGRDHASHRLVALGLSEGRAALILVALAALASLVGGLGMASSATGLALGVAGMTILGALFAVFLSEAPVEPVSVERAGPDLVRYVVEIGVDLLLLSSVWVFAHVLRFQDEGAGVLGGYIEASVLPLLPLLLSVKLVACFFGQLYVGVRRSIRLADVALIFKVATLGSLGFVFVSALNDRLTNLSRAVIVLDWTLSFLGLLATRAALSWFWSTTRRLGAATVPAAWIGPAELFAEARRLGELQDLTVVGMVGAVPADGTVESFGAIADGAEALTARGIRVVLVHDSMAPSALEPYIAAGLSLRRWRVELG